jgi:hypothetical protein
MFKENGYIEEVSSSDLVHIERIKDGYACFTDDNRMIKVVKYFRHGPRYLIFYSDGDYVADLGMVTDDGISEEEADRKALIWMDVLLCKEVF